MAARNAGAELRLFPKRTCCRRKRKRYGTGCPISPFPIPKKGRAPLHDYGSAELDGPSTAGRVLVCVCATLDVRGPAYERRVYGRSQLQDGACSLAQPLIILAILGEQCCMFHHGVGRGTANIHPSSRLPERYVCHSYTGLSSPVAHTSACGRSWRARGTKEGG